MKKHSSDEYAQYTIPIFLLALYSCEETQVNGLTILSDYSGVTMKSISMVGMERIRQYSEAFSVNLLYFFSKLATGHTEHGIKVGSAS